jgi:hypothetical protein
LAARSSPRGRSRSGNGRARRLDRRQRLPVPDRLADARPAGTDRGRHQASSARAGRPGTAFPRPGDRTSALAQWAERLLRAPRRAERRHGRRAAAARRRAAPHTAGCPAAALAAHAEPAEGGGSEPRAAETFPLPRSILRLHPRRVRRREHCRRAPGGRVGTARAGSACPARPHPAGHHCRRRP